MTSPRPADAAGLRRRSPTPGYRQASTADRRARIAERRRRERHFRRRRRDLLEDVALAFALTLVLLTATAGLGVVALLEIPLVAALVTGRLVREIRRRRAAGRRQPTSPRR